ncbi:hypothetical protein [Deinococcus arenicola]|uniref:Uncharacterized protein n=1 Tax=Deinococcus arenicola TaxID=2994950 RepID=A0ABU4DNF7_9DEIO|nr:hypothetical protein [Deinococcus sp. ZS9-10]MDV6373973.1 hypothetical protein [Deinococcus sp. ZS9-10]
MKRLLALLLTAAASTALAYPGSGPAGSRLYAQTSTSSAVVATLPAKTVL